MVTDTAANRSWTLLERFAPSRPKSGLERVKYLLQARIMLTSTDWAMYTALVRLLSPSYQECLALQDYSHEERILALCFMQAILEDLTAGSAC